MTSAKSTRLAVLGAAVSIVLAACSGGGGSATPGTSTAPSTAPSASAGASGGASQATGELPKPEKDTVKIALSNTEMSEWAPIIAVEQGIFEKYGIKAEYAIFEGDAKVISAIQAGQADVGWNGVSSVIASQVTDAPLEVLGVNAIVLTDDIVCQKGLDTADKIKGKTFAISTFGGTSHGAALLGAKALGLTANDVVFTQVGNQTARVAALQGGSVACAVVDSNKQKEMKDLGFSIAVELKKAKTPWGRAGMDALKSWIDENPNTAQVLVAGALEGQQLIWTDPETVIKLHQQVTQSTPEEAKLQIEDFQQIGNRSLMWPDDAFANPKEVLAVAQPDVANVPIEDAFDRSFLQNLVDNGFYEKIGAPTEPTP